MAVIEHTIGTVVANSTVQVTPRVQGQLDQGLFQGRPDGEEGRSAVPDRSRAPIRPPMTTPWPRLASAPRPRRDRYQPRCWRRTPVAPARTTTTPRPPICEAKANVEAARLNLEYTTDPLAGGRQDRPDPGAAGQHGHLGPHGTTTDAIRWSPSPRSSRSRFPSPCPRPTCRASRRASKAGGLTATIEPARRRRRRHLTAPVDFVSNAVTTTGTIELRATFANDDLALVPGQLVDVTVQLDDIPNAIVVPREARQHRPRRPLSSMS